MQTPIKAYCVQKQNTDDKKKVIREGRNSPLIFWLGEFLLKHTTAFWASPI
jgi:hypothetical protein